MLPVLLQGTDGPDGHHQGHDDAQPKRLLRLKDAAVFGVDVEVEGDQDDGQKPAHLQQKITPAT